MRKITKIVVHQSASSFGDANAIDRWHRNQGFAEIGYHRVILNGRRERHGAFLSLCDGKIEVGRDDATVGAHCKGDNAQSLGICLIGDGPAYGEDGYMTARQWSSLVDACSRLAQRYDVAIASIVGHNETKSGKSQGKTCPGFDVQRLRGVLTKAVKAKRIRLRVR